MKSKLLLSFLLVLGYSFANLPAGQARAQDATYTILFESIWSQETHPHSSGSLPSNAHWSRLVGATHNETVSFISPGTLATTGIENVAELGNNTEFNLEVNQTISEGNAYQWIDIGALSTAAGTIEGVISVSKDYPLITLVSMIAPSPDWIITVHDVRFYENEDWIEEIIIDVYPYDAGTDSGIDYTSTNQNTDPQEVITSLQGSPPFSNEKMGTITINLGELLTVESEEARTFRIYPNPSSGAIEVIISEGSGMLLIYNLLGKEVRRSPLQSGKNALDLSALPSGVYLAAADVNGKQSTQKLIIQ